MSNQNHYRFTFYARCPSDGARIEYAVSILIKLTLPVEELRAFCAQQDGKFQESIADAMHEQFGGRQVITATHQGVQITTERG
jgi:hypothetical protein